MAHDVIDNQELKLSDQINKILSSTESAKFAVGYFFISGFQVIAGNLDDVKNLRLLIGNTSSRDTIEQIAEGFQRLELVASAEEKDRFLRRSEQKNRTEVTAENLKQTVERMDQTDEAQKLVLSLVQMIEEKRLHVRVYTKGRMHAKAYIFDYKDDGRIEKGIAVVGSSNFTLSGLTHNTELNVIVQGNSNHARLSQWFDNLWEESQDFDKALAQELKQSWAIASVTPYDIYMKTLHALVVDRLDEGERGEILWDDELTRTLADFQKTAVRQAIQMIRDHGGAFVSDVVGLGKSFIGAAVIKHFVRTQGARPLIICPKPLEEMWEDYNREYSLDAVILPMSLLKLPDQEGAKSVLDEKAYRDRDIVLIDESHNFRHHSSQRYEVLADFLSRGRKKVCLVTATPRNRGALDVLNQIKLFHPDDITHLPIDPPNLKEYFKLIESDQKRLQDLLIHILIRRTRKHILRWYGYGADTDKPLRELSDAKVRPYLKGEKKAYVMVGGRHQYFPKRELETLRYSIEDTYTGLYDQLRRYLGETDGETYNPVPGEQLTYARYGLWRYVLPDKKKVAPYKDLHRVGINLRGLIRVMVFKRFESSVYAFRKTLERLEKIHEVFLAALNQGIVPAGQDAQKLLYESDSYEDEATLMEALRSKAERYQIEDFDGELLKEHIEADKNLLGRMIEIVKPITPGKDAKLQVLLDGLKDEIPKARGKVLIFSQYADTARYLYENINPGGQRRDVESIYGTDKSKARMAARFSPHSNPQIEVNPNDYVNILVATDVMSEGLNLQDGDVVVNYDLHWNPVRLIQRFGRIDRIGTENDVVWGFNFLPELKLEKQLGLQEVLQKRIQEIHDTIGEDAAILDKDEQLNEEAMFAIYEKRGGQLTLFEDEEGGLIDISEAEELMRSLRADDPDEFHRIAGLRDGIRSARAFGSETGKYVFCQAGKYQQLYLTDKDGKVKTRDVPKVMGAIKCSKIEPATIMPRDHNTAVMKVLEAFKEEVKHRRAQQQHSLSLTVGQSYVLRELRAYYSLLKDEDTDLKAQVVKLEESFKRPATAAVRRQLNSLRRSGVVGSLLVRSLAELYHDHGMHELNHEDRRMQEEENEDFPRIICSEAII